MSVGMPLTGAWVGDDVAALRPDYAALLVGVDALVGGPPDATSQGLLMAAEAYARALLAERAVEDVPAVVAWREAFRAFGAKPQRTRPSVETLLRMAVGPGLPRVDRLTDTYNAVSVLHLLPIGGEDADAYVGPVRCVRADGDEAFDTVAAGEPVVEHPEPGEVVWRDDAGVTCRRWNWRQCARTRITASTTTAVFILDGLAALGHGGLHAAQAELTKSLTRLSPEARFASRLIGPAA